MGFQSSRLWFRGADHKDIYFNGKYHDAMYIGDTLVWEKRRALDGWWRIYDGGGYLFLASGEDLKTASVKIMRLRDGAWEYLTSTPDCADFVEPALRFYGATPAIFENGKFGFRDSVKLYRNGAWEGPFHQEGTSAIAYGQSGGGYRYLYDNVENSYKQVLDFYCANDGAYVVSYSTPFGRMKYMAALENSGELKLNPANNDATLAADGTEAYCARQALECSYDYFYRTSQNKWYLRAIGMIGVKGRLFASMYECNDCVGATGPSRFFMAEVSVYEEYDDTSKKRHLYLGKTRVLIAAHVVAMKEADGELLCIWDTGHANGYIYYQIGKMNLDTMQWTFFANTFQLPDAENGSNWLNEGAGFYLEEFMYANGRFYLMSGAFYRTSLDFITWEKHSYPHGIKEYDGSGRVIAREICGRYLDEDGNYHFGPLGV